METYSFKSQLTFLGLAYLFLQHYETNFQESSHLLPLLECICLLPGM